MLEQHFVYSCGVFGGFCKRDLQSALVRLLSLIVKITRLHTSSALVIPYSSVQPNCSRDPERRTSGQSDRACHQGCATAPIAAKAAPAQQPKEASPPCHIVCCITYIIHTGCKHMHHVCSYTHTHQNGHQTEHAKSLQALHRQSCCSCSRSSTATSSSSPWHCLISCPWTLHP